MTRRGALLLALVATLLVAGALALRRAHARFPDERTPEGAWARVVLFVGEGRVRDAFPFLEERARWASYSIRDYRAAAAARVASSWPEPERARWLAEHAVEAGAADGADVFAHLADARGWTTRLRRDLSGVAKVEVVGERATIETARGTRWALRRRDNGVWGLSAFTPDLVAEAEKAARDAEVIAGAADDYARADGGR